MRSANAATVRLSQAVGEERVAALAQRSGIQSRMDPVPALALGALEVTPLELVAAYAPFANGGVRVQPSHREPDRGGRRHRAVASARPASAERVLGRAEAFQITSMLQSVVDGGTGRVLREMGVRGPVAGKTGTTNNGADVWFIGYTPTLVAGFWFGYDSPRPIASNASGGRLAAPAWATFYLNGWHERSPAGSWRPRRRPGRAHHRCLKRRPGERMVPRHPARMVQGRHGADHHLPDAQRSAPGSARGARPEDR